MKTSLLLNKIHAQFNTSKHIVFDLVKKATNKQAVKRTKIRKGFDSEVYLVDTTDDMQFIMKINRASELSYVQEAWVMDQVRNNKVPVADILLLDSINIDGQATDVMVQSVIGGVSLQSRRINISSQQFSQVLEKAGEILARIHKTKVEGCWRRNDNGTWTFPDWQSLVQKTIDDRRSEMALLIQGGLTEYQVEDIFRRQVKQAKKLDDLPLVLNHGDFMPEHIYVNDNLQITGIIDLGDYKGAPIIHDFAFIIFMGPNIPLESIMKGYGEERLDCLHDAIRDYALLYGLGHLARNVKLGRKPESEFNKERIIKILNIPIGGENI